jgi:TRAP-type uncharacterized transport system fused permease subunit
VRPLRLVGLALEAERERLGLVARRYLHSTILKVLAGVAGMFALAELHILAWMLLEPELSPVARAGTLLGFDLALMVVLLVIAARFERETALEREARLVRDTALSGAGGAAVMAPLRATRAGRAALHGMGLWRALRR